MRSRKPICILECPPWPFCSVILYLVLPSWGVAVWYKTEPAPAALASAANWYTISKQSRHNWTIRRQQLISVCKQQTNKGQHHLNLRSDFCGSELNSHSFQKITPSLLHFYFSIQSLATFEKRLRFDWNQPVVDDRPKSECALHGRRPWGKFAATVQRTKSTTFHDSLGRRPNRDLCSAD